MSIMVHPPQRADTGQRDFFLAESDFRAGSLPSADLPENEPFPAAGFPENETFPEA
jgi:hypothetical protein